MQRILISVVIIIGLIPLTAMFVLAAPAAPDPELVSAYSRFFSWMLGVALFAVCALIAYHVQAGNHNNQKQWDMINKHETRLSRIEGICDTERRKQERRRQ